MEDDYITEDETIEDDVNPLEGYRVGNLIYLVSDDGNSYKGSIGIRENLLEVSLAEYTVFEGLLLCCLVCIWMIAICKFLGWCFKWLR